MTNLWEPKYIITCNIHGEIFRTEFDTNIEDMKRTHNKYNPRCKIEVKEI